MNAKNIQKKYTSVTLRNGKYSALLHIGNQCFCIYEGAIKKRANWFCKMVAIALEQFLEENTL